MNCGICNLEIIFCPEFQAHLLTEDCPAMLARQALERQIRYVTCNKLLSDNVYEHHSTSQSHINNLGRVIKKWKIFGTCNVEVRNTIWEKRVKSKKPLITELLRVDPSKGSEIPSFRELATNIVGTLNNMGDEIKILINPFLFHEMATSLFRSSIPKPS